VKEVIKIFKSISIKEFSEKIKVSPIKIIGMLMKNGIIANINKKVDFDTLSIIADDLGVRIVKDDESISSGKTTIDNISGLIKEDENNEACPPIVTVMGHVDHGKTKLLDYMRKSNIVDGESGKITQHIGAYQIEKDKKKITFIDTPGHEAFTEMRARGSEITDIVVIVVALDEGIKPQTVEAISHAKNAKVPIIVALNKIDKVERINDAVTRVKGELAEHDLQSEDWGGDIPMIEISALNGNGIDKLLDTILFIAEMNEIKANYSRSAIGAVVESDFQNGVGVTASILIKTGKLKLGDDFVVSSIFGRVKTMVDDHGKKIKIAGPSTPVKISGFQGSPGVGDIFEVVANKRKAKTMAEDILNSQKQNVKKRSMKDILIQMKNKDKKTLNIILKSDTHGTLEAVLGLIDRLATDKDDSIVIKVIHSGVGDLISSDILMADASNSIAICFKVGASGSVKKSAEKTQVKILHFDIIYKLIEALEDIVSGMFEEKMVKVDIGRIKILGVFHTQKREKTIGGKVLDGEITANSDFVISREKEEVGEGKIINVKRVLETVKSVGKDEECGIKVDCETEIKINDILNVSIMKSETSL